jgi:hypothetical protein
LITIIGESTPLVFGDLDPSFARGRDVESCYGIAGVEIAEDGVMDAGTGADVKGARERNTETTDGCRHIDSLRITQN